MKKLMILLAVACLIFVSCGNRPEPAVEAVAEETCCELTPEQQEMFDNWDIWADLNEEQQMVLVADMKVFMDECKAKCAEKCQGAKEEGEEVCPHKKAKCEEMKAKWEDFDNLTLDEKKALIDEIFAAHKCCKEKETACTHEEE
jgi:TRAP-type C4-dicarboxylate transport system substrate-binding protein